jgi:hypothetical protein
MADGFRKQDSSKRENVLVYQLMLRMCIYKPLFGLLLDGLFDD